MNKLPFNNHRIISKPWVFAITCSEKVYIKKFQLFFRETPTITVRYNTLSRTTGLTINEIRAIPHENNDNITNDNDIALLILASPVINHIKTGQ